MKSEKKRMLCAIITSYIVFMAGWYLPETYIDFSYLNPYLEACINFVIYGIWWSGFAFLLIHCLGKSLNWDLKGILTKSPHRKTLLIAIPIIMAYYFICWAVAGFHFSFEMNWLDYFLTVVGDLNFQNYKERIHIMEERLIAFIIWAIMGVLFIIMGIYDLNSKKAKPFGFWANAEVAPIEDVKGYNRALGILWCVYGVLFTLIGLPLLDGQNSGLIIIPILGAMLISIAAMVAYVVGIEPKYRKKK